MTLAKAKAKSNKTFLLQASLMIVTNDHLKIFIVKATDVSKQKLISEFQQKFTLFFKISCSIICDFKQLMPLC
jgi:hypothetical protein